MNDFPDLSIIIVNWNTASLLMDCLRSIYRSKLDVEVILVDNASTDNSVNLVERTFPQIKLIVNPKNLGFAVGNNQGIRLARSEYILLLNNDTVILNNALEKMLRFMENNPSVGVAGCRTLYTDKTLRPSCGYWPGLRSLSVALGLPWHHIPLISKWFPGRVIEKSSNFYSDEQMVDWVSGACLLTKKEVIKAVGMLDESYFMYIEDVDFCYRVKKANYNVMYFPHASIIHHGSGGQEKDGWKGKQAFIDTVKGYKLFYWKHKPRTHYWIVSLMLFGGYFLRFFVTLILLPISSDMTMDEKLQSYWAACKIALHRV